MGTESLTLKWGTLKAWKFNPGSPAAVLAEKYFEGSVAMGAAQQDDTDEQKELILQIIDAVDAETIYLSWTGEDVDKEAAKRYVLEYGKD